MRRDPSASAQMAVPRGVIAAAIAMLFALAPGEADASPVIAPPRRLDASAVPYPPGGAGDATVTLTLVVDAEGVVKEATVQRGDEPFASAASAAVRTWRFLPATRDGEPIPSRITASVVFRAPPPPPTPQKPASSLASTAPARAPVALPSSEVSVRGEREEPGTSHIPRSETRLIPGAFGDPFRAVEALPGMAPWLSGLPYYYVRGAPPESVGYAIDGIRVPLLFHVGAGPSTLAPALVDSVDLYPGAYPARYGRFAGAIIAGETTPPETERPRAEFGARVFDASAFGELPYDGGRGSVLAAGRYSYTGLVTSLIVPNYTVGYWDYQARVSHTLGGGNGAKDTLALFALGSYDELTYKHQPTFRVEYHRVDLRYDHPLGGGAGGLLRVAATFSVDDTLTALQTSTGAGENAALKGPGARLRAELDERVDERVRLRAGADAGLARFDVDAVGSTVHAPHTDVEGGVYADVVWRPSRGVELVPGARIDAYDTRGRGVVAPQPRVAAHTRITPFLSWISALGVAHQEPTEEVFVPAKLPNPIDQASRTSFQISEALEARLPSSVRVRVTGFAQRIVAPDVSGEERSEGVELFVRRDFTERLGGFASYTLARTDTTFGTRTNEANWDRTHLLSVVLGYDLGAGWRVGGRFFFESGRPWYATCPDPRCSPGQPAPTGSGYAVVGRLPPFYRLDVRVEKRWTFPGGQWLAATLEGFNVLDRPEPISASYDAAAGVVIQKQSPIILPSVGVEGGL